MPTTKSEPKVTQSAPKVHKGRFIFKPKFKKCFQVYPSEMLSGVFHWKCLRADIPVQYALKRIFCFGYAVLRESNSFSLFRGWCFALRCSLKVKRLTCRADLHGLKMSRLAPIMRSELSFSLAMFPEHSSMLIRFDLSKCITANHSGFRCALLRFTLFWESFWHQKS